MQRWLLARTRKNEAKWWGFAEGRTSAAVPTCPRAPAECLGDYRCVIRPSVRMCPPRALRGSGGSAGARRRRMGFTSTDSWCT